MTPMPPDCAMQIAMRASVTVSMAEDRSGILRAMERVTLVRVSAVEGSTEEAAGTSRTSSKVRASRISIGYLLGWDHLARPYRTDRQAGKGLNMVGRGA